MFIELTSDGQPMTINSQAITAVRPLFDKEKDRRHTQYQSVVIFRDESCQYVDQPYDAITRQLRHPQGE